MPNFEKRKDWYLTWEQMKTMVGDGFEIGNHTRNHEVGSGVGPYLNMEKELLAHGLPKPTTLAWPCYVPNPKAHADLATHRYLFGRGGHFRPYDPTIDHPLDIPSVSVKTMKTFVRHVAGATDGRIVVFTFHGVPDGEHPFCTVEPETFKEMMQYLKDHDYKVIALRDLATYVDPEKAAKLPPTK